MTQGARHLRAGLEAGGSRLAGVDFSAARDAGRRIWLARGALRRRRTGPAALLVQALDPAADLPGGGEGLPAALAALRETLAALGPGSLAGLDFPFSLPGALGAPSWEDFLRRFTLRFPGAQDLRRLAGRAGGREPFREADLEARAPFSALNLRLFRQTFHGIRDVLAPLVLARAAWAAPFQEAQPDLPCLVEICPASLLHRLRLRRPYKGPGQRTREARGRILAALETRGLLSFASRVLRRRAVEDAGGDALDAVLAARAAVEALRPGARSPRGTLETLEGRIYF